MNTDNGDGVANPKGRLGWITIYDSGALAIQELNVQRKVPNDNQ